MTPKWFSLIYGGNIHLAPEKRSIPAEEFSKLISAKQIVDQVKEEAETYRKEVASECESLKEQAIREGFEEGFRQWSAKLAELEKEIEEVHAELQKLVLPVALKAAKKIVAKDLESSPDTINSIISHTLKSVAQHKKVTIQVNPEDFATVEKERENFKELFENIQAFSIRPNKDIEPGGCVIETEGGIINAQLSNRWLILENAFQKATAKEEEEK